MAFVPTNVTADVSKKFEQLSEERKQLQAEGALPSWYTTQAWQMFKSKYLVPGESAVNGRHRTIAKTLAKHMAGMEAEWEEKFFNLMWSGVLSPASPALANTGTTRGMPVSCSGQYVDDSVDSFYTNQHETAILSKYGFGTSADFSAIRPRGSAISGGGTANGPVEVIDDFFTTAGKVSQGGSRRGSIGAYLDIEHPDWDEAIDKLMVEPNGKNYGWIIRDGFCAKLDAGDEEANRRFEKMLYTKLVTGKGYLFFVDKANRHRPQMYKDKGLDIKASNLCVAPETLVLTDKGHLPIADLVGKKVTVWNGKEWSIVDVVQTGQNQELLTVKTTFGFEVDCTPYHKFYVMDGYSKVVEKRAHELKAGDKLIKLQTPVIEGTETLNKAYANGFYSGDGCTVEGKARIYLYGGKQALLPLFEGVEQMYVQPNQDRTYFCCNDLQHKFFVPDASYTVDSRVQWFAGLLDSDGCLLTCGDSQTLQICSAQPGFLNQVQLMLQTLGVQSKVAAQRPAGTFDLPANDGTGESKPFECRELKRLLVNGMGIVKLLQLGMKTHRLNPTNHLPNRDASGFVTVSEVVYTGRRDDTYCFTEPKQHMGVFNGLLTGQCSEIMLHSSPEYTYSCILSSLNLVHWDTIKSTDAAFVATVFLDCLCSEFIQASAGIRGLEKVRKFTEMGRAIGLGVMGFHTYLQSKMIPYGGLEAQWLSSEIAQHLHDESLRASKWLAETFGEPEWCKGYGVRNTHRTAYAPTKSTATLMGGVSESWFPEPGMVFTAGSAVGELNRITPIIYELMKERGVYSPETVQDIIDNLGSVQHVGWLSDDEKQVFLNAFELDQRIIFRHAMQRQKWTCQGQSMNFYVSEEGSEALIAQLISMCFQHPDCLSQYYIYSRSGVVVKDECIACSG